jgi:hypothetical protein
MACRIGLLLVGWMVFHAAPLGAAEVEPLKAFLSRPIIGDELSKTEVENYCEAHVPRMPKVETLAAWEAEAERMRADAIEKIVFRGEEAKKWRDAQTKVEWLDTIPGGPGYRIKKLRYEALPGLWIPALLYEPEKLSGKAPVVMNVNGHTGLGKQYPPKQIRCINQARRGMLALNIEWIGMGQLGTVGSHYAMNQLDLCGTSGLAPFYLNMKRGLDVLLGLENADPTRVAVAGLSGGGWQTIIISSLDTRVTLANPVAGYSSFRTRARFPSDLGDSEQTPNDLAIVTDYAHLTAMRAPRPTLLTYNLKDDCCFASGHALPPLLEAAGPIFKLYGKEGALRSHVNEDPGTHNFEKDNRQVLYRMLGDFFYPDDKTFDANEIPVPDGEVRPKEQLDCPVPADNATFNSLATALSKGLPRKPELPKDKDAALGWQKERRAALREIVRVKDYAVSAEKTGSEEKDGLKVTFWKLKMDADWTVPAVELVQGEPKQTAVLVADAGRAGAAEEVARLLASGHRVIAVDPFYFGESKIKGRDFLLALLVAAVGDRPLGLQAGQTAAVARWSQAEHKGGPVLLVALGPRSSLFALVAAALEEKAIGRIELHDSMGSLKEVIEKNWSVNQFPELFCFGLLEAFDIKHLAAVVAPREAAFVKAGDRAKTELADLAAWYRLLGKDFEPLQ